MIYLVLTGHLILCLILVGLVLMQQGKGASAGALLGGSSNTLFGAGGAGNVLTRATTTVAVLFMMTSVLLVRWYGGLLEGTVQPSVVTDQLSGSVMQNTEERAAENVLPAGAGGTAAETETDAAAFEDAAPAGAPETGAESVDSEAQAGGAEEN